jgi:hypothetical protein
MERFWDLFMQALGHHGGDRLQMRHSRGALLGAGFDGVEAHAGADVMGTPEAVRAIATGLATGAQGPGFMGPVPEQGWASREEAEALPAALVAWAERSDACLAAYVAPLRGRSTHTT